MISFSQFLNEVFNKPMSYTQVRFDSYRKAYQFTLPDGNVIKVTVESLEGNDGQDHELTFMIIQNGSVSWSMTNNNKNQIVIMATVVDIVRNHFKGHPLKTNDCITFDADSKDSGRIKLYRRLAAGLAREIHGKVIENNDHYNDIVFKVQKL